MTIVNKASFTNVGGAVDLLDKVRTTAVSWGWTQAEWRDGVVFNATTDAWVADTNGGYLALTSPGQGGSQNLIAKLQVDKMYQHAGEYSLSIGMCNSTAYDLTSSEFPVFQNAVTKTSNIPNSVYFEYGWSLPITNIPEIWILGNSQYIFVVANLDGVLHTMMEFGSYEMREAIPTLQNGSIINVALVGLLGVWDTYTNSSPEGVSGIYQIPSVTNYTGVCDPYWEDTNITSANMWRTVKHETGLGGTSYYSSFTDNYSYLFTNGDNSGRRLMMRSTILYKRPLDGLVVPVSETYASIFNGHGLQPGQSLFYGTDEYIVFPCCSILSTVWLAFRIA